ncbi:hypothetical protein [Nostoc sp. ChiVER01]|uniref:hypothetical protein n=1 Tax=Nostoc sp. ChiVER01 TaxID=3075382 RepID=UPI002AD53FEE|nr:hypothetical protein [Nostoc sp. ChiVER01]MDZ8224700.1 hypothetical protein [Nostoc sp. ChiVER01]
MLSSQDSTIIQKRNAPEPLPAISRDFTIIQKRNLQSRGGTITRHRLETYG